MAECMECGKYVDWEPPAKQKRKAPITGMVCSECVQRKLEYSVVVRKSFIPPDPPDTPIPVSKKSKILREYDLDGMKVRVLAPIKTRKSKLIKQKKVISKNVK